MKLKSLLLTVLLLPLFSSLTFGDTTTDTSKESLRFGIGYGSSRVLIPIQISKDVFIEAEFSLNQYKEDGEKERGGSTQTINQTTKDQTIGIGFFTRKTENLISLYCGVRLGITQGTLAAESDSSMGSEEINGTIKGHFFAPTFGIEYFITEDLSLSGEVRANYQTVTETAEIIEPVSTTTTSITRSRFTTPTSLLLRFYF